MFGCKKFGRTFQTVLSTFQGFFRPKIPYKIKKKDSIYLSATAYLGVKNLDNRCKLGKHVFELNTKRN